MKIVHTLYSLESETIPKGENNPMKKTIAYETIHKEEKIQLRDFCFDFDLFSVKQFSGSWWLVRNQVLFSSLYV